MHGNMNVNLIMFHRFILLASACSTTCVWACLKFVVYMAMSMEMGCDVTRYGKFVLKFQRSLLLDHT